MSETLRTTPLAAVHDRLGARMIEFAGWNMPVWYEGAVAEHHAVRQRAGLFDLSHMAELFVTGAGAAAALDWALLVDAPDMPVGRARYTMICDDDGGIIDDLIAYRIADEVFMVVANASNGPVVLDELVRRCSDHDATVDDRTDDYALVAVQGPSAEQIVVNATDPSLLELRYYRVAQLEVLGAPAFAARTGYTGEDGFELFVPAGAAEAVWEHLTEQGAAGGIAPVGLAARDTLRLEAGMPLYGNELSRQTTPFDVGSARLVKHKAGGFVGSVALAEAAERPHRHLVGLEVAGRRPARTGYDVRHDGASIGAVTSGAPSPTLDRPIAIASVDRELPPGTEVEIDVRDTPTPAEVVELPFYRRPRA